MYLSIVIPAFNEAKKITRDLEAASQYLETKPFQSEILVVDDGSSDKTVEIVSSYIEDRCQSKKISIRLLEYGQNRGKGFAVRHGILASRGQTVAFVDAGLCVPFQNLDHGMEVLNRADCAIASRRHANAKINVSQPLHRRWGSKVFGVIARRFMGVHFVSDTQCGFKLYTSTAAKAIFSQVKTEGFMFDIEALLVARTMRFRILEFPVEWSNDDDTRYHPVSGTIRNFRELMRIRLRSFRKLRRLQLSEVS